MLLLLKAGKAKRRSAAARHLGPCRNHLGACRNAIANWLEPYENGGTQALREIEDPGPAPDGQSIPPEVMEKLKKRLSELKQRVREKPHSYTDGAVASLTRYQYLINTANARPS